MKLLIRFMISMMLISLLEIMGGHPALAGMIMSEFTAGINSRTQQLNWNTAGDLTGHNPNILSELTWTDLEASGFQLNTTSTIDEQMYVTGSLAYGWIFHGANQDSDYAGDNRSGEFSRSNNNANDGNTFDTSIALGMNITKTGPWSLAGLLGVSYHIQYLKMTDGYQTIPLNGSFSGLDSSYTASWNGPWLGLHAGCLMSKSLCLDGSIQYHPVNYLGTGNWNLRTDLYHPVSFIHCAQGTGIILATGINYRINGRWSARIHLDYGYWSTGPGIDITYGPGGSIIGKQQLNQVNWSYWTITLKSVYQL